MWAFVSWNTHFWFLFSGAQSNVSCKKIGAGIKSIRSLIFWSFNEEWHLHNPVVKRESEAPFIYCKKGIQQLKPTPRNLCFAMPHRHHLQSLSAQKNPLFLVSSSERIPILDHIGAKTHAIKYGMQNIIKLNLRFHRILPFNGEIIPNTSKERFGTKVCRTPFINKRLYHERLSPKKKKYYIQCSTTNSRYIGWKVVGFYERPWIIFFHICTKK